jgi:predicted tellurium resistance membrane protein TerC
MLSLLLQALTVALVDIDNAMYTTDQVSELPDRQMRANVLALVMEFAGRIVLLFLFSAIVGAREPLLHIGGLPVRLDHLALLIAGLYLVISNGRELLHAVRAPAAAATESPPPPRSFGLQLAEMGIVLTLLSVDTVLLVLNMTTVLAEILFFFLFSAVLRLLFVDRLVSLIDRFPSLTVFINGLLILIGMQLIVQALGVDFEREFNGFVLIAILVVVGYIWYTKRAINN